MVVVLDKRLKSLFPYGVLTAYSVGLKKSCVTKESGKEAPDRK